MAGVEQTVVREPGAETAQQYARRVYRLAAAYLVLFLASLGGIGLLVWKAQLYVTLAQRSNVQTLTLGFFLIFFAYIAILTAGGAAGAVRIGYYALLAPFGGDREQIERRKRGLSRKD